MSAYVLVVAPHTIADDDGELAKIANAVQAARLYNLVELLERHPDAAGWDVLTDPETRNHVDALVLIRREHATAEVPARAARAGVVPKTLDWTDIGGFLRSSGAVDVAALSSPAGVGQALDDVFDGLRGGPSIPGRTPGDSTERAYPSAILGLPAVIGSDTGRLAVWAENGTLDSEALHTSSALSPIVTDWNSTFTVSADGRLAVVVAQDGQIIACVLTSAREDVVCTPLPGGAVMLPQSLGGHPRVVTAAVARTGTIRLTIATDTGTWCVFVADDGSISASPIAQSSTVVVSGIDVASETTLYRPDGRPLPGTAATPFRGVRVDGIDAAFSGGVTVAVAHGRLSETPTVEVRRRVGHDAWEPVDVSQHLDALGLEPNAVSGVSVERRLDGRVPQHIALLVGSTPHVVTLPSPETSSRSAEMVP